MTGHYRRPYRRTPADALSHNLELLLSDTLNARVSTKSTLTTGPIRSGQLGHTLCHRFLCNIEVAVRSNVRFPICGCWWIMPCVDPRAYCRIRLEQHGPLLRNS